MYVGLGTEVGFGVVLEGHWKWRMMCEENLLAYSEDFLLPGFLEGAPEVSRQQVRAPRNQRRQTHQPPLQQ